MTRDSSDARHGLVALVRYDGKGELREGLHVERFEAADADTVRELVITRAIERAAELGEDLDVRTIDVDAVYPLRVRASGGLDQVGDPEPLQPGDTSLAPVTESLHETVSLPRTSMMAKLQSEPEPVAQQHAPAAEQDEQLVFAKPEPAAEADHETKAAPQPQRSRVQAEADPETDEVPIISRMFADLDDDSVAALDAYFNEGAGRNFDDAERATEATDTAADEDWSPVFPREARSAKQDRQAQQAAPKPTRDTTPQPAASPSVGAESVPTLDDFFTEPESAHKQVAETGWRAGLNKLSGGLITLRPGRVELSESEDIEAIQRHYDGPRTIVVVNPKGGAHKTTTTLMIAAMFGMYRGGYTLAWDNNETRGTLGWRSKPANHSNTAVDLLRELPKFEISGGASVNELDRYVRNQGRARFDVLASDDDAASAAIIDDDAFSRLHRVLSRFYRIMVIDTGNNMRASNWEAAVEAADQLVIVSTSREDTAASAAWLADGLRERGLGDKLANAVTIISAPSAKEDQARTNRLENHFSQLTRVVLSVPYDEAFVGGSELDVRSLKPATRDAWRRVTAEIARGL